MKNFVYLYLWIGVLISKASYAQDKTVVVSDSKLSFLSSKSGQNKKGIGLVIGAANYHLPIASLPNDLNDADSISNALLDVGFDVIKVIDPKKQDFLLAKEFIDSLIAKDGYKTAVLFYSGHGAQWSSINYLLPIDFEIFDPLLSSSEKIQHYEKYAVKLIDILDILSKYSNLKKIVFLDACRVDLTAKETPDISFYAGMAFSSTQQLENIGCYLTFANATGLPSSDGRKFQLKNSVFTHFLVKHLREENMSLAQIIDAVRLESDVLPYLQRPITYDAMGGSNYYFREVNRKKRVDEIQDNQSIVPEKRFVSLEDFKLSNPNAYEWSKGYHNFGESYYVPLIEQYRIENINDFQIEGEIKFYPELTLYFGGNGLNTDLEGAFYVNITGVLRDNALKYSKNGSQYTIYEDQTDWEDMKLSITYGFIHGSKQEQNGFLSYDANLKDWKQFSFKFIRKDSLIDFEMKPKKGKTLAANKIIIDKDFTDEHISKNAVFNLRQTILDVVPKSLPIDYYWQKNLIVEKLAVNSKISERTDLFTRIYPEKSLKFLMYKNFFDSLINIPRLLNKYDGQNETLKVDTRMSLMPELSISPTFTFLLSSKVEDANVPDFYDSESTTTIRVYLNSRDKITSAVNYGALVNKLHIKSTTTQNENFFELPIAQFKSLKILFLPKSICFYYENKYQGAINFKNVLSPVRLECKNKRNNNVSLKELNLQRAG